MKTTLEQITDLISNKNRHVLNIAKKFIPYAYRKRSLETQLDAAQDVMQGAYLKLMTAENLPVIESETEALRFFTTCMRNYAISVARKERKARQADIMFEIGHEIEPDEKPSADHLEQFDAQVFYFEAKDAWDSFISELKSLGISDREIDILTKIYLNEYSFADVGAMLGCNANSISGYVFRAKELIKSRLGHYGAKNADQAMALVA